MNKKTIKFLNALFHFIELFVFAICSLIFFFSFISWTIDYYHLSSIFYAVVFYLAFCVSFKSLLEYRKKSNKNYEDGEDNER